jgi:iron complex transport system permease protein
MVLILLSAIAVISAIVCTFVGPSNIFGIQLMETSKMSLIITQIRLPRVLTSLIVGGGLAAAGAVMQGLFRNPLADPYVIGTSSGGALGAAISIVLLHGSLLPFAAFFGAFSSTIIVYIICRQNGKVAVETLLLSGIAISFFCSAMLSFLMYISGNDLHQIMFWLMGGLWNATWDKVFVGLLIIPAIGVLLFTVRELDILSLGDDEASSLGVNTERIKIVLLVVTSFITGIAVSLAGSIGFIGLIIPHVVRSISGSSFRFLLPISVLAGGISLLWADTLTRTFLNDMPVGIITAFFGAPFFIYLIRRRMRI